MKRKIFAAALALALLASPALAQDTARPANDTASSSSGPSQRLETLRAEMNRTLNRLFDRTNTPGFDMDFGDNPAVDVVDGGNNFVVTAEVPGVDPSNLDVSVAGSRLIIRGTEPTAKSDDKYLRRESISGAFQREITLPDTADLSKAEATYKDGVLTVTTPKSATAVNARKLPIKKLD